MASTGFPITVCAFGRAVPLRIYDWHEWSVPESGIPREWWLSEHAERAVCFALAAVRDTRVVPILARAYETGSLGVRIAVCYALGQRREDGVVPILADALAASESALRRVACRALTAVNLQAALPFLLQLLEDEDDWLRALACQELETVGRWARMNRSVCASTRREDPVRALMDRVWWDTNEVVVQKACYALGAWGDLYAQRALHDIVESEPNPVIRVAALDALVDLLGACAYPLLKRLVDDPHPMVRLRAQDWLASQQNDQVREHQQD